VFNIQTLLLHAMLFTPEVFISSSHKHVGCQKKETSPELYLQHTTAMSGTKQKPLRCLHCLAKHSPPWLQFLEAQ